MADIRILSAQDISQVFTIADALEAVEDAYRQKANGTGIAWPMVYAAFEPGVADMDIRSGELAGSSLFGLKLTAWFSKNPEQDLPEIFGTTLICDDTTGAPLALLNASAITGLRTGAAAALGIKWLARKDARRLMVAGCGHMSTYMVAATLAACPGIDQVAVWDPMSHDAPEARVTRMRDEVEALLAAAGIQRPYKLVSVAYGEAAAREADAIITITPAMSPIIHDSWVRPGCHLSCVGADMEGKQEVDSKTHARARLFVDDRAQSVASGELEVPVKQGAITPESIVADTSGIAVQDLASSKVAYERAVEAGLGTTAAL